MKRDSRRNRDISRVRDRRREAEEGKEKEKEMIEMVL